MGHQQAAQFALRLFGRLDGALHLAARFRRRDRRTSAISFSTRDARLGPDEVGFLVRRGLDLVGGALREQQRVLQRLFHRLEMADALAQIGDFGFERGALLRLVLERSR